MALQKASQREEPALQHAVFAQCLLAVAGTGRCKPAAGGKEGRDKALVKSERRNEQSPQRQYLQTSLCCSASGRKALPAPCPAALEDPSAASRAHAGQKTVGSLPPQVVGMVRRVCAHGLTSAENQEIQL
jgi:hypothetical protein